MSKRLLVIRPLAASDAAEAAAWYEAQRPELGDAFLDEVGACIRGVSLEPESFRKVHRELRRAFVRRFPYFVIFLVTAEEVVVAAIVHAKRRPATWKRRR